MSSHAEILLIEDNTVDAMFISKTLRDSNVSQLIKVFQRAEEALAYLSESDSHRNGNGQPRLMILDLKLPGMNGFDFLYNLRSNPKYREIPVVAFSGSNEEHDRKMALDLGADGFITKSFDMRQFLSSIEAIGKQWLSPSLQHH